MAAVLLLGVFVGIEKYQKHQDKKRARIQEESSHARREAYFHDSKAAEAEAATRSKLERRSSQDSLASWEGSRPATPDHTTGLPKYEDVVTNARNNTEESSGLAGSSRLTETRSPPYEAEDTSGGKVKGKGKGKKLWRKVTGGS